MSRLRDSIAAARRSDSSSAIALSRGSATISASWCAGMISPCRAWSCSPVTAIPPYQYNTQISYTVLRHHYEEGESFVLQYTKTRSYCTSQEIMAGEGFVRNGKPVTEEKAQRAA